MTDTPHPTAPGTDPSATYRWRMSPLFVLRHAGMPFEWLAELGADDALVALADRLVADDAEPSPDPELRQRFERAFDLERATLRARLRETIRREEVRAAIFLSSPDMFDGMLRGYLERDVVPDNARFRRVERQVYLYLQRFCGKNETTSTFGPMGYGEVDDGRGLRVERAPVRRCVQLARWALEELARAVARDRGLRAHVPLWRSVLADDDTTLADDGAAVDADDGAVARAVWRGLGDGPASLAQLAAAAGVSVAATAKATQPLLARGVVHRGLRMAAEVVDGLAELRRAVADLPDLPQRASWLAELDALDTDRRAFAGAAVSGRQRLLAAIESRFTRLTGVPARRGAGDMYADRLVLFEEASSPFRLRVGADLAAAIERAAGPGLDACAEVGSNAQREHHRQVAGVLAAAGGELPFTEYADAARPAEQPHSSFDGDRHVLTVPAAPGSVVALDVPDPGALRPAERYALPDLCLLGGDPDSVSARPRLLLARVHHQLLLNGWLTTFAADPERFDAQAVRWLTGTRAGRATAALATTRRNKGFYRFPGRRVLITPMDHEGRPDVIPATRLRVRLDGDRPVLVDGDGRPVVLYPMLADLTGYPPIAALTDPPVVHRRVRCAAGTRLGRVYAGSAVYQRATWTLPLAGLAGRRGADAFLAVRALARGHGLPRYVFVRVAGERKPVLVDLHSPFAVDVLCHLAKGHDTGHAEEMLPGPDELWLADERGHYTCELRVQFLRTAGSAARATPAASAPSTSTGGGAS